MNARWWIVLCAILLIAGGLRVARARSGYLTFDEQWHMELSTGRGSPHVRLPDDEVIRSAPAVTSLVDAPPAWSVWSSMDFVVHPPLYCTSLRLWRDVFGGGDFAAQLFSVVCSVVAIAMLFDVIRRLTTESVAAWACLILAVAPAQVALGQQVRGYALLQAVSMGACVAIVRLEKLGVSAPRTIALGACMLGMMLTHYFAAGACAAILLYALMRLPARTRNAAIATCGVAALFYAITWGPFLWQQRTYSSQTADPWLTDVGPSPVRAMLARVASAPGALLVQSGPTAFAWVILTVLVIGALQIRRRSDSWLWWLWLAGTLGLIILLDLLRSTRQLDFMRYFSLAAPAVTALIASAGARLRSVWRNFVPAAVVVLCAAMSSRAYIREEPDWRALGMVLDARSSPGEVILFYPGAQPAWYREIFYLGAAHYSHGFPRPIVKLTHPAGPALIAKLPSASVWLISGQLDLPPETVLPGYVVVEQIVLPNLAICTRMSRKAD